MNHIHIGKKKYSYPSHLKYFKAAHFLELATIAAEKPEEGTEAETMEWIVDYLTTLLKAPKKVIKQIDVPTGLTIIETVEALLQYEPKDVRYITVKGERYYFQTADKKLLEGSTFGEYMDAMNLNKFVDEAKGGQYDAILKVMAVYCRPLIIKRIRRWFRKDIKREEIQPYTGANWETRYKLFKKHCTMADVNDFAFFLTGQTITSMRILTSLAVDEVRHKVEELEGFMDGMEDLPK